MGLLGPIYIYIGFDSKKQTRYLFCDGSNNILLPCAQNAFKINVVRRCKTFDSYGPTGRFDGPQGKQGLAAQRADVYLLSSTPMQVCFVFALLWHGRDLQHGHQ